MALALLVHTVDRSTLGVVTQVRTGHRYFCEYYQTHNIREPANCSCEAELEHRVFECRTHEGYGDIIDEGAPEHQLATLFGTKTGIDALAEFVRKARRSRKHEPRRSLRGLQMQNRVISDPVVQRDPIETPPDPPRPTKTSPTRRASDSRAYRVTYQTRERTPETILENVL